MKTCEHKEHEDCMICCVCGKCSESLDEEDVCSGCRDSYHNFYKCVCGKEWDNWWSCGCNDKCPECNSEIEPYKSEGE